MNISNHHFPISKTQNYLSPLSGENQHRKIWQPYPSSDSPYHHHHRKISIDKVAWFTLSDQASYRFHRHNYDQSAQLLVRFGVCVWISLLKAHIDLLASQKTNKSKISFGNIKITFEKWFLSSLEKIFLKSYRLVTFWKGKLLFE